jgi:hypothetical protein
MGGVFNVSQDGAVFAAKALENPGVDTFIANKTHFAACIRSLKYTGQIPERLSQRPTKHIALKTGKFNSPFRSQYKFKNGKSQFLKDISHIYVHSI